MPNPNIDDAISRYEAGQSLARIIGETPISKTALYRELRRRGIPRTRHIREVATADLIAAYQQGASVNELARRFEVSRTLVTDRLVAAGVSLRDRSDASRTRWTQMPDRERGAQIAGAHNAIRGSIRSERERVFGALSREASGRLNQTERALADALADRGLTIQPQRAVGRYNIDLAIPPVAVEVFGGRWHGTGRSAARLPQRLDYIFDQGWAVYVVWHVPPRHPLDPSRIAEDVCAYLKLCRSEPAGGRRYRVVRGDGQLVAEGRFDGDHRPFISPDGRSPDPLD